MKHKPGRVRTRKRPRSRDIERAYSRNQLAAKLRRLATALERREVFTIRVAGETLCVPADAMASIEHERQGGVQELEFQLRWPVR